MTSEGTNEVVRKVPPTLGGPKQQLPTLRIKKRKIASNVSSSDRSNLQLKVSVVAPQRRQYGLIPTFGQPPRPRQRHATSSVPTVTNSQIDYNDDDDDDRNAHGNAEFDDDTIDHYIANTVESLEAYIAIQSLQQSIETSITVPLALGSTGTTTVAATGTTTTFHHIRGVLECQIFECFTSVPSSSSFATSSSSSKRNNTLFSNHVTVNHHHTNQKCSVSKQKLLKQLQHLQQQNVITCIPIVQDETSHNFYLFTKDYIQYIVQQQRMFDKETTNTTSADTTSQSETILQWWIRQLRSKHTIRTQGRAPYLTVHDFEQALSHDPPRHSSDSVQSQQRHAESATTTTTFPLLSASMIIQHLQDAQLILSASYDHCTYQLFLPKAWGTMVLPKFSQLCKDVILYIKRSSYHERSMASILERFHNHQQQRPLTVPSAKRIRGTTFTAKVVNADTDIYISIPHVIIPYLVSQRRVQRIERPSGMFVTFIE